VSATVFDGKALVNKIIRRIKRDAELLRKRNHIEVGLGLVLVTGDQVAMADTGKIAELASQAGVKVHIERVAQRNVARKFYPTLEEYAASPFIQGIFIQLPLPVDIVPMTEVMKRLPPKKDVACLHFINRGISTYPPHEVEQHVKPPEILAVTETLKQLEFEIQGGKVVVVGSNATAGMVKMLAGYLYDQGSNVRLLRYSSIARDDAQGSKIKQLESGGEKDLENYSFVINPEGEAVITWANHPGWLSRTRLSPQSTVIDLGYKFARGKISGDCDFMSVVSSAKAITPVPGGIRTITYAMVLQNLIDLINIQLEEKDGGSKASLKRRFK